MDRREAYLRRAWRLAALLTGDRERASAVILRCLVAQPNLVRLPPGRLDRLVIQQARDMHARPPRPALSQRLTGLLQRIRAGHRDSRGLPMPVASAPEATPLFSPTAQRAMTVLLAIPSQRREAWILRELDSTGEIDASKAMDCSRAALARHLSLAESAMRETLGDGFNDAVAALKRDADGLDPEAFILAERRDRRRRTRWLVIVLVSTAALCVIGLIVAATLLGWW